MTKSSTINLFFTVNLKLLKVTFDYAFCFGAYNIFVYILFDFINPLFF